MSAQYIMDADDWPEPSSSVKPKKASRLDSGIGSDSPLERCHSYSNLLCDVEIPEEDIESCPWNTENADLFLKVKDTLFPVHRSIITLHSVTLRIIIYSVNYVDEETPVITLKGHQSDEIKELLSYIYYPQKEVYGK